MSYNVVYHTQVKNDVLEAKEWYKTKQTGLEKRFSAAVTDTIKALISNPFPTLSEVSRLRNNYLNLEKHDTYAICICTILSMHK